ncbi:MAG: hypothetical protein HYS27_26405 [Deltaproteobacteria bacterium]|nr:hypothetical protein [Deltaproteobacteria bacterium]
MAPTRMVRALLLTTSLVMLLPSAACRRPCDTEQHCKRTCECLDNTNDTRLDCTIAFRCEGEGKVCEDSYDTMACDDLCSTYAARALCGTQRCSSNANCEKVVSCPLLDESGNPVEPAQSFTCTRTFECDLTLEVCDAEITQADEAHCAFCRATAGQGG